MKRAWAFIREFFVQEFFTAFLFHPWNRLIYAFNPNKYGLDTPMPKSKEGEKAKVILFLHGQMGNSSCFLPLAKKLLEANIDNLYTVNIVQSRSDSVPTEALERKIEEITRDCLSKGYSGVDFALIGHSLGALVSSKYIWGNEKQTNVSMLISLAGRLKYVSNDLSWFCSDDERGQIQAVRKKYLADPEKALLYTIRGDQDGLIPEESAHIQGEKSRGLTVDGYGHGGIVFAPKAIDQIVFWIKSWIC